MEWRRRWAMCAAFLTAKSWWHTLDSTRVYRRAATSKAVERPANCAPALGVVYAPGPVARAGDAEPERVPLLRRARAPPPRHRDCLGRSDPALDRAPWHPAHRSLPACFARPTSADTPRDTRCRAPPSAVVSQNQTHTLHTRHTRTRRSV